MVVIGALPVVRFLLALHYPPVFLEDTLGELHQQRPRGVENARDFRPADKQQTEGAVDSLLSVEQHIRNLRNPHRRAIPRAD